MAKRHKTKYPGVFYYEVPRQGGSGTERSYYIVFSKGGKVYEEPAGRQYRDKMTQAKAARIRGERIEGKRKSPKEIREARERKKKAWTFEKLFEEYKAQRPDLKSFGPDENRIRKYLLPAFGHKRPEDIHPLDVDRLRVKMQKRLSPQSVKQTLSLLVRVCNFGHRRRLSKPLGFAVERPRVDNITTEDLTAAQLKELFEAIEHEDSHPQAAGMMQLALFTGMRRGEMFRLKWKDIDFERGFIRIRDPKGGKSQQIPLNDQARALLKSTPRHLGSPFVFPGRNGRQRTDIHRHVNEIKKRAGLPKEFRPLHGLRHVYASMLASSGQVDMYTLQKLLTHKDPKMTQRYAHLRDETLRKASDVAAELVSKAIKPKGRGKGKVVGLARRRRKK